MHIKGEGHTTKQNDLIHIEDCACPVSVHVPSLSGIIPRTVVKSMVTITGPSTPRLSLFSPTGNGIDYLINDTQTGTTLNPWLEFTNTITFQAAAATKRLAALGVG